MRDEGFELIVRDIVSAGRRVVVQVADLLGGQDHALRNARRASTEVSRRRVERDEATIYLDSLAAEAAEAAESADAGATTDRAL